MGQTPGYLLPYPETGDPAAVPTDIHELATRVEAVIIPGTATGQVLSWRQDWEAWAPATLFKGGTAGPFTVAADASFPIPHGLGYVPAFFVAFAAGWAGYLFGAAAPPDSVNIYLVPSVALAGNYVYWMAF